MVLSKYEVNSRKNSKEMLSPRLDPAMCKSHLPE